MESQFSLVKKKLMNSGSPFSQLGTLSPGSTLNFSTYSPFPFSPNLSSPALFFEGKNSQSKRSQDILSPGLFSPPDIYSPFKAKHKIPSKSQKGLFTDNDPILSVSESDANDDDGESFSIVDIMCEKSPPLKPVGLM